MNFCVVCFFSVTFAAHLTTTVENQSTKLTVCGEHGDCVGASKDCEEKCGCDGLHYYNATTDECQLDQEYLKQLITEKYNTERKIAIEAEKVFHGITISIILFLTCASLCVVTACFYCFHINYTDQKLSKDVEALAKKLKRDGKFTKSVKTPVKPVAESCQMMVPDAGVFVV